MTHDTRAAYLIEQKFHQTLNCMSDEINFVELMKFRVIDSSDTLNDSNSNHTKFET